jgi:hypothetical protein
LSIDELPQLWNVLVGDMSLVGPRPERPHFVDQFSPTVRGYKDRHRLPVGLTGLAQVNGLRGDTSIEQRARLDNYYIEHWSPWQDILILVSTLGEVWRNARSDWYDRRSRVHEVSRPSPPDPDRAKALDGSAVAVGGGSGHAGSWRAGGVVDYDRAAPGTAVRIATPDPSTGRARP